MIFHTWVDDLNLVSSFLLQCFSGIAQLLTTTILCSTIVLWLLSSIVKVFRKVFG